MGIELGNRRGHAVRSDAALDAFISYSHAADGLLAPRLQSALQRFAKPWWKRRAIRVFRDETSLSANPHLWSSITEALDSAGWFILLLSPDAADSQWVNREVEYWLDHKDPDRILPVLTEGRFVWDERIQRVAQGSSVPSPLLTAFSEEPRWVDLRWARHETHLDLRDSRFRGAVADIASAVRGVPKDDLESEEVRQHRRTVRTAWTAGLALAGLAVATGIAAIYANSQRQEAVAQRLVAEEQTEIAVANEVRAGEQTVLAEEASALARSRELAASAINVLADDPELSILLGLEAIDAAPPGSDVPIESVSALRQAIHGSPLLRRERIAPGGFTFATPSPDGTLLMMSADETNTVQMVDPETWEVVWEHFDPETIDTGFAGSFSPDGTLVAIGYLDSTSVFAGYFPEDGPDDDGLPARAEIREAATGDLVQTFEFPDCPSSQVHDFSPDGTRLAVLTGSDPIESGYCTTWRTEFYDTETWELVEAIDHGEAYGSSTWSGDGTRFFAAPGVVYDAATMEPIAEFPTDLGVLNHDGSVAATLSADWVVIELWDVESGRLLDRLSDGTDPQSDFFFGPDGSQLFVAANGPETVVFDVATGRVTHRLPTTGAAAAAAYDPTRQWLYHGNTAGEITVWDLSGARGGEFNTIVDGRRVLQNSFAVHGSTGAFAALVGDGAQTGAFDPTTGAVTNAGPWAWGSPSVLGADAVLVSLTDEARSDRGPTALWNPTTGETTEIAGCWLDGNAVWEQQPGTVPCSDREGTGIPRTKPLVSPDGTRILLTSPGPLGTGEIQIYDAATLEAVSSVTHDDNWGVNVFGGDWVVVVGPDDMMTVRSLDDWSVLLELGPSSLITTVSRNEVSQDGGMLAWTELSGGFTVVDTSTWGTILSAPTAHTGRTTGLAFSPDLGRLFSAGSDDFVKIWDLSTGEELQRIRISRPADGHWVDDDHIIVATEAGVWTTLTLDLGELLELARSRLTRDFTPEECTAYRIEDCG